MEAKKRAGLELKGISTNLEIGKSNVLKGGKSQLANLSKIEDKVVDGFRDGWHLFRIKWKSIWYEIMSMVVFKWQRGLGTILFAGQNYQLVNKSLGTGIVELGAQVSVNCPTLTKCRKWKEHSERRETLQHCTETVPDMEAMLSNQLHFTFLIWSTACTVE